MLMTLRQGFKEHGLRIILWFTIIAMGLGFAAQFFIDKPSLRQSAELAVVNDTTIDSRVFAQRVNNEEERVALVRQQLGNQFEQYAHLLGIEQIAPRVLENMIQETVVAQAAGRSSLTPRDEYIMNVLNDPQFAMENLSHIIPFYVLDQQRGTVDPQLLQRYLHKFGISIQQFEQSVEQIIASGLLYKILSNTLFVSPEEIKARYIQNYVPRSYEIINFTLDEYRKKAQSLSVSDQELRDFIVKKIKTEERYIVPEKRSGIIWTFKLDDYGIEPSEKALKQYYDKHKFKNYVETPAQVQVREIELSPDIDSAESASIKQAATENPDTFADLARKHSVGQTASQGGLLKPFSRGTYDTMFERQAFGLEKPGSVAVVEATGQPTRIIQLVQKKATVFKPFESVKKEIISALAQERFAERFSIDAKHVSMQAQTNEKAVSEFAQKHKGTPTRFTEASLEKEPRLFTAHKTGMNSFVQDNEGTIVELTEIKKAYEPSFESIKETARTDWYEEKAWELLHKNMNDAFVSAESFKDIADSYGARYETTPFIDPQNQADLDRFAQRDIEPNSLLSLTQPGSISEAGGDNNGYLIRLSEVAQFTPEDYTAQKDEIYTMVAAEKRELTQRGFVASLLRNAKLTYNETFTN